MASISQELREAVLQAAIQGKLTEQLPEDGDARDLLAQIKVEKERLIKEKKIKKVESDIKVNYRIIGLGIFVIVIFTSVILRGGKKNK